MFYVYFRCDEWKSNSSMSFVGVFDENGLRAILESDLQAKDIEGLEVEDLSEDRFDVEDVNRNIEYGHIEVVELNEVQ